MLEPCIMDVKIGKRTWDPLAPPEKRAAEEQKYSACKQNLGLCIPGFQVHNLTTGKCKRFDKDYGKKLNEKTIKDALRIFLNAESGLCRVLLTRLLSGLYCVLKWARAQKCLKLYSSSLLLVYDARSLRNSLEKDKIKNKSNGSVAASTPSPNLNTPPELINGRTTPFKYPERKISEPVACYKQVQRCHSSQHNYDKVS